MYTPPKKATAQQGFFLKLEDQLDGKHSLYILANIIDWKVFEDGFRKYYSKDKGAPAKPIRLMVGLLILKHIRNVSDEVVVEQWSENMYYQYFCGNEYFECKQPCDASELCHFRDRIGDDGMALIFKESIRVNGNDAKEASVLIDTTVKEKNITFPTDNKLHRKIIVKCKSIAEKTKITVRQSYKFELKKLGIAQRFRNHPTNKGKAKKADKRVKVIAGRLVRELERKLPVQHLYKQDLALFNRVLRQQKNDKNKIYSLNEPAVKCISKGKEHKKYEFGNKVAICLTENTGVITGVKSFEENIYDGHALKPTLENHTDMTGSNAKEATVDRGCKGNKQIGETKINIPGPFDNKKLSKYQQKKQRQKFKRRASIEPIIGHLKQDHRLGRNFYKGIVGDSINLLLAAAAFNFKRMMNKWKKNIFMLIQNIVNHISYIIYCNKTQKRLFKG